MVVPSSVEETAPYTEFQTLPSWHIDVLECPRCHGRLKVIAAISEPAVLDKILNHLNLPTTLPTLAPARAPPDDHGFDADPPFETDDDA